LESAESGPSARRVDRFTARRRDVCTVLIFPAAILILMSFAKVWTNWFAVATTLPQAVRP